MIFTIKHHPETIMEYLILKCSQLLFSESVLNQSEAGEAGEEKQADQSIDKSQINYPLDQSQMKQEIDIKEEVMNINKVPMTQFFNNKSKFISLNALIL
jgi:hypothetical protein